MAPYSRYHYHFTGESSSGLVRRGARHLGLWWVRLGVVGVFLVGAGQALGLSEAPVGTLSPVLPHVDLISTNLPETSPFQVPEVVAQGFHSPDGIALEPTSGDIYLSDEDASSIYRIQPDGTKREIVNSHTRIYEGDGRFRQEVAGLRTPEGLALDGQGQLYVVEDYPGGRLLVFDTHQASRRRRLEGEVVPIPLPNNPVAWESVDVGPKGEILLAGSTVEYVTHRESQGTVFMGVVLYRDAQGEWWMLLNHPMTSYSAASFSADGNFALIAAEIPGFVGCVDLRTKLVRTFLWDMTFRSPEGIGRLSGGAFMVTEESGRIYQVDPTSGSIQLLYEHTSTVESVLWDTRGRRMLITDDQHGQLVAVALHDNAYLTPAKGTIADIPFQEESTPVDMVPRQCPPYLAQVLKLGGYDPQVARGGVEFRDFAKRYCMVAIDATVQLMPGHTPVDDPIERIQFVVIAPYLMGYREGELLWSSSGFTVVLASGRTIKTELVKRQVLHGDLMEVRFTPVGGSSIALPMPFSARINSEGHVAVNFLGMGVMADFYLVLDSTNPGNSLMVVVQPDGFVHQYLLSLPHKKNRAHWVIALERQGPDTWKSLGGSRNSKAQGE
ncbi:MAG: hypothetical protein PHI93_05915 [Kiritimatiellae bacterium]|nr:hypothetical protein [Kiritimatiellia bacterium]